jgi:VWFA-related protein
MFRIHMRRHVFGTLVWLCGLALALGAQQPGQTPAGQPSVTFRVEVNYVEVDASVVDRQGKFVGDLQKADFQVLEDGVAQEITAFSLVSIPIERIEQPLFTSRRIEPDVATNARPFDGRLYVIVLDDLHTAPFHTIHVKRAAKEFVEKHMADNDLAAVVHTSGRGTAGQEFTSSKGLLLAAIDRFHGSKLRSSTITRLQDYEQQQVIPRGEGGSITKLTDSLEMERGREALRTLDALQAITEWVGGIRGRRKAIVFLSEGIDYDIYDFNKRDSSSIQDRMRDIIATSARSNVSIYAADPRGLTSMGDESIEVSGGFPQDPQLNLRSTSFLDELRLGQQNLRSLAEDTGGFAAVDTNSFSDAWARVVRDNSQYYVLGYYSTNEKRDGRFRKIDVRVPGREGLEVRSRKGYTAPRGKPSTQTTLPGNDETSPELRQALDSPIPLPGITLRVHAAAFRAEKSKASVAVGVEVQGADLQFASREGKFVDDLEISVIAIDAAGKIRGGDRSVLNLGLKPDTRDRVAASGIRTYTRLTLDPGRYQVRVAARETGAGRIGTINHDLEVPDFSKTPFAMSDIVLTAASSQQVMTAKVDDELKQVLPAPPTSMRVFPPGDMLVAFAEVYDNAPQPTHIVDIKTTVVTDEGTPVFSAAEERSSDELQGKPGGYGHTARIGLRGFRPGLYVLRIEAKPRTSSDPPIAKEVVFHVRQPS